MRKTAILILAAGSSSRMGEPKQLLPYKNTTLLGWTIKNAQKTSVKDIFCVLGSNANSIEKSIKKYSVETIYNPNYKDGLSSSIVAGIDFISRKSYDSVLILLADQPKITSSFLKEILKTSEENNTKIIASNYAKNVGVPAIFPKQYFEELSQLTGDKGAKELLQKSALEILAFDAPNLLDIDTKEDYKKILL